MRFLFCSALIFIVLPVCLADSPGSWRFLGPSGGSLGRILFDPTATRVVYAQGGNRFSGGPLFRSVNSGLTWKTLGIDGEARIHPRTGLLMVYTGSGLNFSTDRGNTWRAQTPSLPQPFRGVDVEFDSQDQSHLYYISDRGVYISHDAGQTFARTSNFPEDSCPELEVSFSNGNIAYANGGGLAMKRTTNGGKTWVDRPQPRDVFCNSMAVDPVNPNVVYLGGDSKIYKTVDGGKHWAFSAFNCDYNPPGIAIDQKDPRQVFVTCSHVVHRSTDGGSTWANLVKVSSDQLPGAFKDSFTVLSVDPRRSLLLLGVMPQGIMRSEDTGLSWKSSNRGLANLSIESVITNSSATGSYFAAGTDLHKLLYHSTDQGETWRLGSSTPYGMNPYTLVISPSNPDMLATHSSKLFFLTTDSGRTWATHPAPYINRSLLAFDPRNPSIVYLGGTNYEGSAGFLGFGVAKSTDSGATWRTMNQGLTDKNIWALAVDPSNPNRLLVESLSGKVFQYTGSGTWTLLNGSLPRDNAHSISISPLDPNLVYLSLWYQGTFRSTDGGKTWISIARSADNPTFWGVFPDPSNRNTVYAPYSTQVYVSRDTGSSWEAVGAPLPTWVTDLSFIPGGLLAATQSGVFEHSR